MHRHHILPKHSGGDNSENNLTQPISTIKHAMFHWCEWQRTGNIYDKIAWKALVGQIEKEEIKILAIKEYQKRKLKEGNHPFQLRNWDVSNASRKAAYTQIKNGTLSLLKLDLKEINKKSQDERVKKGIHHFLKGNETWDRVLVSKETNKKRVDNGTHPFLTKNRTWDPSESSKKARKNMSIESIDRMIRLQTVNRRIKNKWTIEKIEFINSIKNSSSSKIFKECRNKFNWPNSRGVIQNILKVLKEENINQILSLEVNQ